MPDCSGTVIIDLGLYRLGSNFGSFINFRVTMCCAKLLQSCLTLCDSMDYSLPGFSAHGILQARILERVAISFSRGSSPSRDQTGSPALQADFLPSDKETEKTPRR